MDMKFDLNSEYTITKYRKYDYSFYFLMAFRDDKLHNVKFYRNKILSFKITINSYCKGYTNLR